MKTTLDLDEGLLARAKAAATRERTSLTQLIEEGLSLRLRPTAVASNRARGKLALPVFEACTGLAPGIDPSSNKSMYDAADEDA